MLASVSSRTSSSGSASSIPDIRDGPLVAGVG